MVPQHDRACRPGGGARRQACIAVQAGMAACSIVLAAACAPGPAGRPAVQASPCSRAFVFVDHGRPAARIEVPEDASGPVKEAADLLQTSIFRMSGLDLPVFAVKAPDGGGVAAIGFPHDALPQAIGTSLPALRPDGFVVATSQGSLFVSGGEGRGVVRGVARVLEKYLGCSLDGPLPGRFPRRDDIVLGCLFEIDNP